MELGGAAASPAPRPLCLATHRRLISGVLVTVVTGVTWAGFTELLKTADQSGNFSSSVPSENEAAGGAAALADQSTTESTLKGAAGLTYFFTAWLLLAFPPYLAVNVVLRQRPVKAVLGYVRLPPLSPPPPPSMRRSVA